MKKQSIRKFIEEYLDNRIKLEGQITVCSRIFQVHVKKLMEYKGVMHNPDTFSREWRRFKSVNNKYVINEIKIPGKIEKYFNIRIKN